MILRLQGRMMNCRAWLQRQGFQGVVLVNVTAFDNSVRLRTQGKNFDGIMYEWIYVL